MNEIEVASAAIAPVIDIELQPVTDIARPELKKAVRLPLAEIAAVGGVLASLPESMRTVSQTVTLDTGRTLFEAFAKEGISGFMRPALDGLGYTGNIVDAAGTITGRARFVPTPQILTATESVVVPFDPVTLAVAVALAQVNHKLEAIQETQQEIFDFLKREKRSEQLGDLNTLVDIMGTYKFNWGNEAYRSSKHIQVCLIKQEAERKILFYRDEVSACLEKGSLLSTNAGARKKSGSVAESLKDYQLALYLFAFSSLLEVLLLGNFDSGYLESVRGGIDSHSLSYLELYTRAFGQVENAAQRTVESRILGGASSVASIFGRAIEKTPVGEHTQIDEALLGAGGRLKALEEEKVSDTACGLCIAKGNVALPFAEAIGAMNRVCNEPLRMLSDGESLFLLSEDDD